MSPFIQWLASTGWEQVVKALLHTLWQGALAAALLAAALRGTTNPATRYKFAAGALAAVLLTCMATWAAIAQVETTRQDTPARAPQAALAIKSQLAPSSAPTSAVAVAAIPEMEHPLSAFRWTPWLALCWIAGASLMLLRGVIQVVATQRMRQDSRPAIDARLQSLFAEARERLRIVRDVRLAVTDRLTSPAIIGILMPALIVPLSILSTLTPDQIRFVLLHELAHIRRGDYIANLFQMFAEALLFFNPAVWWISHRMRIEREACCDAMAIASSGAPADYARTLVQVAEMLVEPAPAAAAAFGGSRRPSSLMDRVQRLLVPGYRPSARLTWRSMLVALFAGTSFLLLSAAATRVTMAAILSPRERMDRIEKKMAEYGVQPVEEKDSSHHRVLVRAHLRMADGSPLPAKSSVLFHSRFGNSSGFYSAGIRPDGTASNVVTAGEIWAEASMDGYAPAIAGPFDGSGTNVVDAGELILDRGFETVLRIRDADTGAAIGNATVQTAFIIERTGHHLQLKHEVKSDPKGVALLSNCVSQSMQATISAPDYELAQRKFPALQPNQTLDLRLKRGVPLSGRVVDKKSGQGIAGASIRLLSEDGEVRQVYGWNDEMRLLAISDDQGAFNITQLRRRGHQWLGVSAPGRESKVIETPGDELTIKLGPELIVRGRVIGNIESLEKHDRQPSLGIATTERFGDHSHTSGEWLPIRMLNGVATFEFTNRVVGPVSLSGGGFHETRDVMEPIQEWVVDLANPDTRSSRYLADKAPKRELIFRFKHPSGAVARGTVMISLPENVDPNNRSNRSEDMAITNGTVRVNAAIGGKVFIQPRRMPGFWFDAGHFSNLSGIDVTNGPGPIEIEVPLVPAGAIYATARNADGSPAGGLSFGIVELEAAPSRRKNSSFGSNGDSFSGNAPRKWVSGPLPLGGVYQVTGHRGNSFCASKPIRLTESVPDAEVELQFIQGKALKGQFFDPAGVPVADADLEADFSMDQGHGFGLPHVFTDSQGRFVLEDASWDLGQYSILANVSGLRAERFTLDFNVQSQVFRLKKGNTISGRIVEAGTGFSIPGAEVSVADLETLKLPMLRTKADNQGRFEFTSLGDATYTIFVSAGSHVGPSRFRAGVDTNATVTIKLYPWIKIKPVPAQDRAMN